MTDLIAQQTSLQGLLTDVVGRHLRRLLERDGLADVAELTDLNNEFLFSLYGHEIDRPWNVQRLHNLLDATAYDSLGARLPGYNSFRAWFTGEAERLWKAEEDLSFHLTATTESVTASQEDTLFSVVEHVNPNWLLSQGLRNNKFEVPFFQLWLLALRIITIVRENLFELYDDVEFTDEEAVWLGQVFDWYDRSFTYNELMLRGADA